MQVFVRAKICPDSCKRGLRPSSDTTPEESFSPPEAALLLVSTKNRDLWLHSGQTTGHSREHARDLSTSSHFPSSSHKISTINLRHSSHLGTKFNHSAPTNVFSRVLLLRQQPFLSENLPPERPTTTIAMKTQVFMFRYELVNSTGKFTIVAEIVSLLKKIYKRDASFRAVFKVKTLAVLFSPSVSSRNETHTTKFKSAAILVLSCFYGNGAIHSHARAWLKHVHSFDRCGTSGPFSSAEAALLLVSTKNRDLLLLCPTPEVRDSRTSRHSAHAQSQV